MRSLKTDPSRKNKRIVKAGGGESNGDRRRGDKNTITKIKIGGFI